MAPVLPFSEVAQPGTAGAAAGEASSDEEAPRGAGSYAVQAAPGQVGLEYLPGEQHDDDDEAPVPAAARPLFKGASGVYAMRDGPTRGWLKEGRGKYRFAYFDGTELHKTELVCRAGGEYGAMAPDRAAMIVSAESDQELWHITLADGQARKLYRLEDGEVYSFVALANGDVVVADSDSVRWLVAGGSGELVEHARLGINPYRVVVEPSGRAVLVEATGRGGQAAWVLARDGATVRAPARFKFESISTVFADPRGAFVWTGEEVYRVTGAADALGHLADFEAAPLYGTKTEADQSEDDEESTPAGGLAVDAGPGQVGLAFVGTTRPPDGDDVPSEIAALFKNGTQLFHLPDGFAYGWLKEGRGKFRFAYCAGGKVHPTEVLAPYPSNAVSVRHDRKQLAIATAGGEEIWRVDLEDGKARSGAELEDDESVSNFALLADGSIVAQTSTCLAVLVPEGDTLRVAQRYGLAGTRIEAEADGRVAVLEQYSDPGMTVLARDGETTRVLATFAPSVSGLHFAPEGALLIELDDGGFYKLTGLREALAHVADFPAAPAYAPSSDEDGEDSTPRTPGSHAVEAAPGQVGLAFVGTDDPPDDEPEIPKAIAEQFKARATLKALSGNFVYGWMKEGRREHRFAVYDGATFRPTSLTSRDATEYMAVSPDRARIVTAANGEKEIWEVTVADGKARKLWKCPNDDVYGVALLASGHVAAADDCSLWILAPDGDELRVVQRLGINPSTLGLEAGQRVLLAEAVDEPGLWALALDGETTRALFTVPRSIDNLHARSDGALIEIDGSYYKLTGLDAALGHLADFAPAPLYSEDGGEAGEEGEEGEEGGGEDEEESEGDD